jgi:hypothetical protein
MSSQGIVAKNVRADKLWCKNIWQVILEKMVGPEGLEPSTLRAWQRNAKSTCPAGTQNQLPRSVIKKEMVGPEGLEPSTCRL